MISVGRDLGPALGIDLARVDEALGRREHRREVDAQLDPAVVVLAAQVERPVVEREVPHAGRERQAEQLGQLRADLARVGVDGVPAREDEIERALVANRRGERRGGGERVGAGEGPIGDQHAPDVDPTLEAPARSPRAGRPRQGAGRG